MKFGFRKPRAIAPEVQLPLGHADAHGHPKNCLNCGATLAGAYCHNCGQSASTHRMSFAHFLFHDFVHGVWHLDKGFPAMFKKVFVNPGKNIRAYLAGKRVGWFNILTMILVLLAVSGFVEHISGTEVKPNYENELSRIVGEFLSHNTKWLFLGLCFVCSWSSTLVFRRPRFNLSEHTVINAFFLVGMLSISLLARLYSWWIPTGTANQIGKNIFVILLILYLAYAYFNTFRRDYTLGGWLWRYLVHGILSIVMLALVAGISVGGFIAITGREFNDSVIKIDTTSDTTSTHAPKHAPAAH